MICFVLPFTRIPDGSYAFLNLIASQPTRGTRKLGGSLAQQAACQALFFYSPLLHPSKDISASSKSNQINRWQPEKVLMFFWGRFMKGCSRTSDGDGSPRGAADFSPSLLQSEPGPHRPQEPQLLQHRAAAGLRAGEHCQPPAAAPNVPEMPSPSHPHQHSSLPSAAPPHPLGSPPFSALPLFFFTLKNLPGAAPMDVNHTSKKKQPSAAAGSSRGVP